MQTIVSMTDILVQTTMTTCQNDAVQTVLESITLMKQLANDVLDISKIEAGKLTLEKVSFDLRQCIRTSVHGFVQVATTKKLDFKQELASDLPVRVVSDPTRFHQIFLNLLSNAFKVLRAPFPFVVGRTSPYCLDDCLCAVYGTRECRRQSASRRRKAQGQAAGGCERGTKAKA
jgi:signal transduction histidine kinase